MPDPPSPTTPVPHQGVGKGLLGVVAKPVTGVMGLASQTLQGVGNTAGFLIDGSQVRSANICRCQLLLASALGARLEQHCRGHPSANISIYLSSFVSIVVREDMCSRSGPTD